MNFSGFSVSEWFWGRRVLGSELCGVREVEVVRGGWVMFRVEGGVWGDIG